MIRKITIEDLDSFNYLGKQVNDNFEKLFNLNNILNEDYSLILVYEINNKVVAFIHVNILYENIDIINIVVDKDYRCQQVGSKLVDHLITNYLNENMNITLEVNANNKAAIKLYKKFNFEIINIRKKYYCNGNAYLMERR